MKFLLILFLLLAVNARGQYTPADIVKHKIAMMSTKSGEYKTSIYYDQWGNDTAHYINGEIYQRKTHTYKDGKLESTSIFSASGEEYSKSTYTYNADGSSVATNKDADFGMTDYTYFDKAGRILKTVVPDGSERIYSYDKSGKLLTIKTKPMKDAAIVDVTYKYDSKNRMIKETSNGDFKWSNTYSYNENGLIKNKTVSYVDEYGAKKSSVTQYTYKLRK